MTPSELISEGSNLMLFGMGFVFLFLTVLVLATSLMSKIIGRFFQEPLSSTAPSSARTPTVPSEDTELVAVIGAAIRMHRARQARVLRK